MTSTVNAEPRRDDSTRRVGRVVLALVVGLAVGLAVAAARQPALSRAVGFLEPIGAIWVNAIRMTVVPLVVATGATVLARLYGVELSIADELTIVASAVALSFATPGVPNGAFLLLAPVLASVGLPAADVALLIAIDSIPDLFATLTNVTGDFAAVAIVNRWSRAAAPATAPDVATT